MKTGGQSGWYHSNRWMVSGLAWALYAALAPGASAVFAWQDDRFAELVLLRNGQVIEGDAVLSVDQVRVETRSGSRMVLPTSQVELIAQSWDELWEFQRDRVSVDDREQLTTLLRWCLSHRQIHRAWEVLDRLQMLRVPAAELELLRRQIALVEESTQRATERNRPPNGPAPADPAPSAAGQSVTAGSSPAADVMADGAVRPVSFEPPAGQLPGPIPEEILESFALAVPEAGVRRWRREAEPVLLRSCATAGCHSPHDALLPWQSLGEGEPTPVRMSQQNLYRAAQFLLHIPRAPDRFMQAAVNAHGGAALPAIQPDSHEYRLIAEWVRELVAAVPADKVEPPVAPPASRPQVPRVATIALPGSSRNVDSGPARATEPRAARPLAVATRPPEIPDLAAPPAAPFIPRDEFDPEIFNRFLREGLSITGSAPADDHAAARALGLPDLQELIEMEKRPDR